MYDPMTVAFRIPFPWPFRERGWWPHKTEAGDRRFYFHRYWSHREKGEKVLGRWWVPRSWDWHAFRAFGINWRLPPLITIWHVDPETDGTDDSCRWFHPRLTEREKQIAANLIDDEFDNLRGWFGDANRDEMVWRVRQIFRIYRREFRWRLHPRWHVWHWKIQVHPVQTFKRWAFSRCAGCGNRFAWGYSPVTGQWYGTGPRWFRGEKLIYHGDCYPKVGTNAKQVTEPVVFH